MLTSKLKEVLSAVPAVRTLNLGRCAVAMNLKKSILLSLHHFSQ